MSRKLLGIAVLVVLLPLATRGQSIMTGNQFVFARVSDDGLGHVTWYEGNGGLGAKNLSFTNKSYLHLLIGGLYYSNSDLSPTIIGPPQFDTKQAPDVLLNNGKNRKIGDTIETTWPQAGFDVVQDVYPVAFSMSGQLVVRFKIVNHSKDPISAQSEFLLDIDPMNDKAKVLTRWGYSPNWTLYPNASSGNPIPPFFMALQNNPNVPGFTGLIGTGYVSDSLAPAPLHLIPPGLLLIGGWVELSYYKWGYPDQYIGTAYGDNAVLYQWPMFSIPANNGMDSVQEIGSLSYGTGEFCQNFGQVFAMLLRPSQLTYDKSTQQYPYIPPVEALIFNMSSTTTLSNVKASLTANGPLHIVGPAPVTNNGAVQTHATTPATINPLDVADVMWNVAPNSITSFPDTGYMALDVTATGLTTPVFVDGWDCPTYITETGVAGIFPKDTIISRTGSYDGSLCNARCSQAAAYDLRLCAMCGISGVHTDTAMNMSVTVQDSFAHFTACVLDSMKDGFANVIVSDFDGSRDTVRFTYCTIPDKLRPTMTPGNCKQGLCYTLGENRPWDRGIDTIITDYVVNMNLAFDPPQGSWHGASSVAFTATPIDPTKMSSFCIDVKDLAGNSRDTCLTLSATAGVGPPEQHEFTVRVMPNPSYGVSTISLGDDRTASIEVLDLLGRMVDRFDVAGSRERDMSHLPNGTYILRANSNGVHASARIVKE